jgi:hypothetical protein
MSEASDRFGWGERERLRRYVTGWENRLALDTEHVAAIRVRLEAAPVVPTDEVPTDS